MQRLHHGAVRMSPLSGFRTLGFEFDTTRSLVCQSVKRGLVRSWSNIGPASNMALQRTRGLAAAQFLRSAGRRSAVQDSPGGRSPLNARSLGVGR